MLSALAAITLLFGATRALDHAAAETDDEMAFVAALNAVRAEVGLPALQTHQELADLARDHARVMADAGEIFHASPISAGLTADWQKLGENVGVGASVDVLVDAFVASPGHYANIVDPAFTHVGVGVVWAGPALYTTHRFLQPATSALDPPPTTTTPATTTTVPVTTTTVVPTSAPVAPPSTTTAAPPPTTTGLEPQTEAHRGSPPPISVSRVRVLIAILDGNG